MRGWETLARCSPRKTRRSPNSMNAFCALPPSLRTRAAAPSGEKADAGKYAIKQLAGELVTVADNFDRALAAVPVNQDEIGKEALDGLITGIRMTEKELLGILERYQVFRVFPKGERFDPNLHQAVAQVPGNGIPVGHVVDVAQPGFVIGDRVLRAAMVTVSLGEMSGADRRQTKPTVHHKKNHHRKAKWHPWSGFF